MGGEARHSDVRLGVNALHRLHLVAEAFVAPNEIVIHGLGENDLVVGATILFDDGTIELTYRDGRRRAV
jgi:hypothetical protein